MRMNEAGKTNTFSSINFILFFPVKLKHLEQKKDESFLRAILPSLQQNQL